MALPPNIVLILTDQQRYDTIAALGSSFAAPTPAMDRLARFGISFDRTYCTSPICGPSRSSIMTGLYPSQTGIYANLGNPCSPLRTSHITVGHRLQSAGYETVYHGKWHLGGTPKDYGFETVFENSHDPSTLTEAARYLRGRDWLTYKRPFFQVVSFLNPHDVYFLDRADEEKLQQPFKPWPNAKDTLEGKPWPQKFHQKPDWSTARWSAYRRWYEQCLETVDRQIGEFVNELVYSGFGPNTWILLTSDHGDSGGEHGLPFKGPWMYDGVLRVPMLLVPPQKRFTGKGHSNIDAPDFTGTRSDRLTSLIDLVPTITHLAGLPPDANLPGQSLLRDVENPSPSTGHERVFAEWHQSGKLVSPIRTTCTKRWKYNWYLGYGEELYDLQTDPAEINNLATNAEHASVRNELRDQVETQLLRTKDPFQTYRPTDETGNIKI